MCASWNLGRDTCIAINLTLSGLLMLYIIYFVLILLVFLGHDIYMYCTKFSVKVLLCAHTYLNEMFMAYCLFSTFKRICWVLINLYVFQALFWAVNKGEVDIVTQLVNKKAKVNIRDRCGQTVIELAHNKGLNQVHPILYLYT